RAQARVQERAAHHGREDDGGREDGADGQGRPRPRRCDPPAGWTGGGHERGRRPNDHRGAARRGDGIRRQGDAGQQGGDHRAVHRVWHRNDGHAVSSVTKSIPELADRYLMQTGRRLPVTFVRGRGCLLYDDAGREYLDLVAGIAVNLLGHAHPEVVAAVTKQSAELIHTSNLYFTQPQVELARRLVDLSFPSRVFFCNSGAEANEAAIKLARKWGTRNRDGAFEIITTTGSFHGRMLATVAAGGQHKYSDPFQPLPDGFVHVAYNDAEAVEAATTEKTVAVMLEPVMGEIG